MPSTAPICVVSKIDPSILELLPEFLSPNATPAQMNRIVRDISTNLVQMFLSQLSQHQRSLTIIPILRAALPMYAAALPLMADSPTVLVRCSKDKSKRGAQSVMVEWMGGKPSSQRQFVLMDTVLATGDTVVKLCDELQNTLTETSNTASTQCQIAVIACYASPQALAAVASHPAVRSIFVAYMADSVDSEGYLVPYTHGDIGDKLFGKPGGLTEI